MKLLLHVCCANCATVPIEILKDKYDISLLWYGPNIHPVKEHSKRLSNAIKLSKIYKIELIKGSYDLDKWNELTKGLGNEPEGGHRCNVCFQMRLTKTAQVAKQMGFDIFATTLTIGPQKKADIINAQANKIAKQYQVDFYSADFKKKDGFKKSIELSKKYNFYRQNYCGCRYSNNDIL